MESKENNDNIEDSEEIKDKVSDLKDEEILQEEDIVKDPNTIDSNIDMDIDDIATALFVKNLIQKVQKELKYARRKQLDIKSIDYDMSIIVSKQTEIHDCYKEKLEHLCFDFEQE